MKFQINKITYDTTNINGPTLAELLRGFGRKVKGGKLEKVWALERLVEELVKAEEPCVTILSSALYTEEPKTEEPQAQEPQAQEPKAEEPKAEEPKAEEPNKSNSPDTANASWPVHEHYLRRKIALAAAELGSSATAERIAEHIRARKGGAGCYGLRQVLEGMEGMWPPVEEVPPKAPKASKVPKGRKDVEKFRVFLAGLSREEAEMVLAGLARELETR